MVTIKEVAQMAGVSIATVSNYLNNTRPVRKFTATKIQKAIDALDYKPNVMAKNLKSQKYNDIGIILPNFDDPYYVQLFQGMEYAFQQSPYYINLALSYDRPERERDSVQRFLQKQICGLILISCMPDSWKFYYDAYVSKNYPLVLLDREIDNLETSYISFDNKATTLFLTQKLLAKGYHDLILITGPAQFTSEQQCIEGFSKAFGSLNVQSQILCSGLSKEDSFRVTTELFRAKIPDAIITTSENGAIGIIEAMMLLGFSTDDIPVVTLGEEHWNKHTHSIATLSTIRPAMHMGELSASLLMEQILSPMVCENKRIILSDKILDEDSWQHPFFREAPQILSSENKHIEVLLLDTSQVHALMGLIPHFTKQTGIMVHPTIVAHHQLYDRIIEEQKASSFEHPTDVFMFDIPWLYSLASGGILSDITDYVRQPYLDQKIFLPNCFDYFSEYDNRYFGLPFMYAPQILYYRRDLFENKSLRADFERLFHSTLRPPQTWKEFNAISEFFTFHTDAITYGTSIPAAYPECLAPEIYMRIISTGGALYDKRNRVVFNSAHTLKAYIYFMKALKSAKPDYMNTNDTAVVQDFLNGETAMLISYPSFIDKTYNSEGNSSPSTHIGYGNIPGHTPILGGWSFGINNYSRSKEESFQFIKWACTNQISDYFSLLGGYSAVERTYINEELVKLYPWFPLYHAAYKHTKPILPPKKLGGEIVSQNLIDAIVCNGLYDLIEEKSDIPTILERTHHELEHLIASS